jgi:hypothetical protein
VDDEEHVKDPEQRGRHREEVHGSDPVSVVPEERAASGPAVQTHLIREDP